MLGKVQVNGTGSTARDAIEHPPKFTGNRIFAINPGQCSDFLTNVA